MEDFSKAAKSEGDIKGITFAAPCLTLPFSSDGNTQRLTLIKSIKVPIAVVCMLMSCTCEAHESNAVNQSAILHSERETVL